MGIFIFFILTFEAIAINLIKMINPAIQFGDGQAVICILLNSILLIIAILSREKSKNGIKNFNIFLVISYLIRVIFLFWDRYYRHIFTFPNSGLDTGSFDVWARQYVINRMSGNNGYAAVLGWIYKFFYPNPLWGQYINVIASVLTISIMYKILCKLDIGYKYKFYGVLIICFLPNYLIMSAILLRESLITLLLTNSIYHLIEWWYSNRRNHIFVAMVCILCATYLHSGTIAYAVAIILIAAFAGNQKREFKFKPTTVVVSAIGIVFFMFIYNNFGNTFFGYMGGIDSVEGVMEKTSTYATGGSAYSVSIVDDSSIVGLIVNSPIRIFYFIASPLPWQWRGITDMIAFVGSGLFYTTSMYWGLKSVSNKNSKNRNLIIAVLIIALCSAVIYSWGVSNAGTALRHRDKFIANFILLLLLSLDSKQNSKKMRDL